MKVFADMEVKMKNKSREMWYNRRKHTEKNMLSTIKKENGYDLYTFEGIDLKIRVYSFEKDCKVFINYKGYNISSTMMFWDCENECLEYNLTFETAVTELKNANTLYFIVKKEILNPFIDEIYYFIMENIMDSLLTEEKKVDWN